MALISNFRPSATKNAMASMKLWMNCPVVKKSANEVCKLSSKVPEVKFVNKLPSTDKGSKTDGAEKKLKSTLGNIHVIRPCNSSRQMPKEKCLERSSVAHRNQVTPASCNKQRNPTAGCKRKYEEVIDNTERKKLKMDRATALICDNILLDIMNFEQMNPFHPRVKKPVDLEMIKQKLQQDEYQFAEEFEADVRHTFSTAMLHNPRGNCYHAHVKELQGKFDNLWRPIQMRKDFEESNKSSVERRQNGLKTVKVKKSLMSQRGNDSDKDPKTSGSLGATLAATTGGELSPNSRIERLRERFSETILKAQKYTDQKQGGGSNAKTLPNEKMKLQIRRKEEKAKIEAKAEAPKSAARSKSEAERKKERDAKREASRKALDMMDKSGIIDVVDENNKIQDELKAMIGQSFEAIYKSARSRANSTWSVSKRDNKPKSPLEQLGLYIKEEYQLGSDYIISMDEDLEEGEIVC